MPAISRIRFTNLVFEDGAKRYNDVIFQFDTYNGVILLENGGGKTVLVQAVLQTILPHTLLGERKAKDTFVLENSPAHLAVEWLITDRPRRYALTAVTLFHSKEGMDSYKYVYEYGSGDENSLEELPFVRKGQNGHTRPSSKEEMADYYQYMSRNHLNAHYFSRNREYQNYIEDNFKIINSEWKSVARINAAEGAVEGFFEGCSTTTQLVNKLLIPTVEEALAGGGTKDFVETFEKQREHFKKHRQLQDKIEESQQVDMQINSYVNRYAVYEEASQALLKVKGETRSLYRLAVEKQEQVEQRLEEYRQANERLQEQRHELERKQSSYRLASRRQELDQAGQIYEQRRKEYEGQQEEYDQKNSRLQNLEIARLKARIRSSEELIKYYMEQIENLAADPDVRDLEEKIENNAGYLHYRYLQEKKILDDRRQKSQTELDKANQELQETKRNYKEQQDHYYKLRENKGQAEQQRNQAENDMQSIASQILANPAQEEVIQEKQKWEQRVGELERNRLENQVLVQKLQKEKCRLLEELEQLRPQLQTCGREEQSLKDLNERIQEEQASLLLRMKELKTELYSVHSLYTQQSTVINQFEDAVENLRLHKERAILKESQALALHTFYESSSYYGADPLVETWIDDWREQFSYLESGAVYVEKAAQHLEHSVSEYFQAYPFWAISLVCGASEADSLLIRLRRQAMVLTHPIFILTQEEARSMLDSRGEPSHKVLEAERRIFPTNWEVNLSSEAFQNWKQELEKNAMEAGSERRQQEARLQEMVEFTKQLQRFWEKYPYEETCQLQRSWRELRKQLVELDQGIRTREERLQEIDPRLDSLSKKNSEIIEEHTHLSNRIMKAQDYHRKTGERDKAELDLQQCQELLLVWEQELDRINRQKERGERKKQGLQQDLLLIDQEFRYLLDQPLYQEVKATIPRESKLNRTLLETERRDLLDALHQKQKGRESLEDRLSQARIDKKDYEKDLERKRRKCDVEIDEDLIFPPGGDEEINVIIKQTNSLKQLLKGLEPGLSPPELS
jgi:DNA repair exonuclease SbcCD ATPase subunit